MASNDNVIDSIHRFERRHREIEERLNSKGGGGTSPPMADDTLSKRVDGLQTLVYSLVAVMVAGFIAIFGAVVVSSNTTNTRIDGSSATVSTLNREVGVVGAKVDESNKRLDRIDQKLEQISAKLDKR